MRSSSAPCATPRAGHGWRSPASPACATTSRSSRGRARWAPTRRGRPASSPACWARFVGPPHLRRLRDRAPGGRAAAHRLRRLRHDRGGRHRAGGARAARRRCGPHPVRRGRRHGARHLRRRRRPRAGDRRARRRQDPLRRLRHHAGRGRRPGRPVPARQAGGGAPARGRGHGHRRGRPFATAASRPASTAPCCVPYARGLTQSAKAGGVAGEERALNDVAPRSSAPCAPGRSTSSARARPRAPS